jgi:hypothetical protein
VRGTEVVWALERDAIAALDVLGVLGALGRRMRLEAAAEEKSLSVIVRDAEASLQSLLLAAVGVLSRGPCPLLLLSLSFLTDPLPRLARRTKELQRNCERQFRSSRSTNAPKLYSAWLATPVRVPI